MKESVRLLISGIVQGVFYRKTAHEKAESLGITGYIRNNPDGEVEIYAEGEKEALVELIAWCQKGPPHARVREVVVDWQGSADRYRTFQVV